MADILSIVKKIAIEAVESSSPTQVYSAKVESIAPFSVSIDNGFKLGEEFLSLSAHIKQLILLGDVAEGSVVSLMREQGGQRFLVIDLLPDKDWVPSQAGQGEKGDTGEQGPQGEQGENGVDGKSAKLFSLSSSAYTVAYSDLNEPKSSENIVISAKKENLSANTVWYTSPSAELVGSGDTKTLSPTFFKNNNHIKITATCEGYSDTVSIIKVVDGDNSFSVVLTNESHSFLGDENAALEGETYCDVIVFKGEQRVVALVGALQNLPLGINYTIEQNATISPRIKFNVSEGMSTKMGVIDIPITVENQVYIKNFSFSLSLKGEVGVGISEVIEQYCLGSSKTTEPVSGWSTVMPQWQADKYIWARSEIIYSDGTKAYSKAYCDSSWEIGVFSLDVEYYLSTSATVLSGGEWTTTAPAWQNNKFMWTRTVSKDAKGGIIKTSNPSCIAGARGETGMGVNSISTEYYLSSSKEELLDSSWTDIRPAWTCSKFLWLRTVIVYSDESVVYYDIHCDNDWREIIDEELLPLIERNATNIEKTADEIRLEASSTYVRGDDFETYKETAIELTSEQIEFVRTSISERQDEIENTVSANQEELKEYIRFNGAEISLGRTDSKFGTVLDNEELKFTENGERIAYVSNQKLNIKNAQIENELRVQNFVFKQRDNGNFSLVFVGE